MLKFVVSIGYKKFKFEDSASAMTFAAIAKNASIDDENVEIEIVKEDEANV